MDTQNTATQAELTARIIAERKELDGLKARLITARGGRNFWTRAQPVRKIPLYACIKVPAMTPTYEKMSAFFAARTVENRPIRTANLAAYGPETDVDELLSDPQNLGYAEDQSFWIEYVDATGAGSARTVTAKKIAYGSDGVPLLKCYCSLRNSMRNFRVDRIRCIADTDGVVAEDHPEFLVDTFGMHPVIAEYVTTDVGNYDQRATRTKAIKDIVQHDTRLLAALSHSDGAMIDVEVDQILPYLDNQLAEFTLDSADIAILDKYVRRMRLTEKTLKKALRHFETRTPDDQARFFRAAHKVILADGFLHNAEVAMINDFSSQLTGVNIV